MCESNVNYMNYIAIMWEYQTDCHIIFNSRENWIWIVYLKVIISLEIIIALHWKIHNLSTKYWLIGDSFLFSKWRLWVGSPYTTYLSCYVYLPPSDWSFGVVTNIVKTKTFARFYSNGSIKIMTVFILNLLLDCQIDLMKQH